ncbi:DUF6270 domain-containing protein [Glutamicibacter ardleyensis]|uniref:DUF6270 domain-containing protein n=1 Tax=Glutamicibacter ardleyensis TaxID=225894 RepID=UPI003FD3E3B0
MFKAFIYGSCVARDTMNFFSESWERPTYFARQSMISAASRRAAVTGSIDLESPFQTRMVKNDIAGSAMDGIQKSLTGHDVMLIDLIDERRGVYQIGGGGYVTHTAELAKSKLMTRQSVKPKVIPFGTDLHWNLWSKSAEMIASEIQVRDVRCIVVAPPWASISSAGDELLWMSSPVHEMNHKYNRYYKYLSNLGFDVVTVPESDAVGDANHQWGLSPFHYVESVYLSLRDQIIERLE